jgi:hypothetical protein
MPVPTFCDAALFAAEKRCAELRAEIAAIGDDEDLTGPLDAARIAAERIIFETPPDTLAAAAAKLRLLAHPDRGVDASPEEVRAIRQILELVERQVCLPAAEASQR